jgi:hypothetical protein
MCEASRVTRRLERIEALCSRTVPKQQLLGELRALVREAELEARSAAGDASAAPPVKLRKGAEGMS